MILATPSAIKVEGKTVWYHLNHCSRVEAPGRTLTELRDNLRASAAPLGKQAGEDVTVPQGERRSQRLAKRSSGPEAAPAGHQKPKEKTKYLDESEESS